jgi:putative metalloprotease
MKAALRKAALIDAISSQSDKVAKLTDSQLGQIGNAILDSKHSRKQESEADTFSYDFMKKHGYDVNAVESAFNLLASQSGGASADFLSRMMSSHPDPKDRAETAKQRAIAEGLYKAYVQKPINNKVVVTKTTTKKTTTKKKKK